MYTKEQIELLNNAIKGNFPFITPANADMKVTHSGISRMVMLDRYAQKDISLKTLVEGDLVVVKIKPDPKFPTLGIGRVSKIEETTVEVQIEEEYTGQIDPNLLVSEGLVKISKSEIQKPLEIFYDQIANRVGKALGQGESDETVNKFINHINDLNIVPAGRVLYGAGSNSQVTYFNCYVMPMPHDSREGISEHRREIMEIMSRGGGVGTNGSTLRPRDTVAISVGGKSSGAVSWLNDFATLTDLVQQGGSRRGAQMIMLQDWHPDIIEFIISKMQKPEVLKWIMDNFEDESIRAYAKEKLKFEYLSNEEREIHEDIVENTNNIKLLRRSQKILKAGGVYKVHRPEFLSGAEHLSWYYRAIHGCC